MLQSIDDAEDPIYCHYVFTGTYTPGKNIVFTLGNGKITLAKAKGKTIRLKDRRGSYTLSKTKIKLGKDFKGTMDAAKFLPTITKIDGRNAKNKVNITGNAKSNTIYAGKAGAEGGNDLSDLPGDRGWRGTCRADLQ